MKTISKFIRGGGANLVKSPLSLSLLSTFRTELMGFAAIWVYLFHCQLHCNIQIPILGYFTWYGYGGVDIFLLLSGVGLYYSYSKDPSTLHFYRKRLSRIFPTYILIVTIYQLITYKYTIPEYILNITTIAYWVSPHAYDWYIPTLILLYLLFPILFRGIIKKPRATLLLVIVLSITLTISLHGVSTSFMKNLTLPRFPIFVLGVFLGKLIKSGRILTGRTKNILLSLLPISFFLLLGYLHISAILHLDSGYEVLNYFMFFIAPLLCICLVFVFCRMNRNNIILRFLRLNGKLSLEVYLIHAYIVINGIVLSNYFEINIALFLFFAYWFVLLISFLVHCILRKLKVS